MRLLCLIQVLDSRSLIVKRSLAPGYSCLGIQKEFKTFDFNQPDFAFNYVHNGIHSKVMRYGRVGQPGPTYVLIDTIGLHKVDKSYINSCAKAGRTPKTCNKEK